MPPEAEAPTEFAARIGSELTATHFRIRDTEFEIRKLLPIEGFEVFETIREAIRGNFQIDSDSAESAISSFVRPVLALPRATVDELRRRLFAHVYFRNRSTNSLRCVGRDLGAAFDGLEPIHIYEVLARALAVNFQGSFSDILSRFSAAADEASDTSPSQP